MSIYVILRLWCVTELKSVPLVEDKLLLSLCFFVSLKMLHWCTDTSIIINQKSEKKHLCVRETAVMGAKWGLCFPRSPVEKVRKRQWAATDQGGLFSKQTFDNWSLLQTDDNFALGWFCCLPWLFKKHEIALSDEEFFAVPLRDCSCATARLWTALRSAQTSAPLMEAFYFQVVHRSCIPFWKYAFNNTPRGVQNCTSTKWQIDSYLMIKGTNKTL